jgi:hypothetical protein
MLGNTKKQLTLWKQSCRIHGHRWPVRRNSFLFEVDKHQQFCQKHTKWTHTFTKQRSYISDSAPFYWISTNHYEADQFRIVIPLPHSQRKKQQTLELSPSYRQVFHSNSTASTLNNRRSTLKHIYGLNRFLFPRKILPILETTYSIFHMVFSYLTNDKINKLKPIHSHLQQRLHRYY